jgi:hypothetical protein
MAEPGLNIAVFIWTGSDTKLASTLVSVAKAAEAASVIRVTVMDHLRQIGPLGPNQEFGKRWAKQRRARRPPTLSRSVTHSWENSIWSSKLFVLTALLTCS